MREFKRAGIAPKKGLGQHFLVDTKVAQDIVRLALLQPHDIVVEIGPGIGALTLLMLPLVRKVVAVEVDRELADYLRQRAKSAKNLEVVHQDVLEFDFGKLACDEGRKLQIVANLPYNISTPVIFRLIDRRKALDHLTLTLQREVAERIVANPGGKEYGSLSIFVQLFSTAKILMRIPSRAFYPQPQVESATVGFRVLPYPRIQIGDMDFFRRVVRTSFGQRRKTILNALTSGAEPLGSKAQIKRALEGAGIEPGCRAEMLGLADFKRLVEALEEPAGSTM